MKNETERSDINTNHYRWSLIPGWVILDVVVDEVKWTLFVVAVVVVVVATAPVSAIVAAVVRIGVDDSD